MKYLTIVSLFFLMSTQANAQLRFGLKSGFDISDKDILNTGNRLGFQIGGTMELMTPFIGLGGELSVIYGHQHYDVMKATSFEYDLSDYNYLRVPFNLKKKISVLGLIGIFVQAGPYAEFKLSGGDFSNIDNRYESKSFGAGINAGAGVELISHLELGMYYRKALTSNYKEDTPSFNDLWKEKDDTWSVNLTYFF